MNDHLEQIRTLTRELLDAAELLPDDHAAVKLDIQTMLWAILDRVLAIENDLLKLRSQTCSKQTMMTWR